MNDSKERLIGIKNLKLFVEKPIIQKKELKKEQEFEQRKSIEQKLDENDFVYMPDPNFSSSQKLNINDIVYLSDLKSPEYIKLNLTKGKIIQYNSIKEKYLVFCFEDSKERLIGIKYLSLAYKVYLNPDPKPKDINDIAWDLAEGEIKLAPLHLLRNYTIPYEDIVVAMERRKKLALWIEKNVGKTKYIKLSEIITTMRLDKHRRMTRPVRANIGRSFNDRFHGPKDKVRQYLKRSRYFNSGESDMSRPSEFIYSCISEIEYKIERYVFETDVNYHPW